MYNKSMKAARIVKGSICLAACAALIFFLWPRRTTHSVTSCPQGSYDAGGFCKSEPTGCPNGDSIPIEKCEIPVLEEDKTEVEFEPMIGGK